MSVGPQVTEYLVGPAERWFAVDHPAVTEELAEKTAEDFGLRQGFELSVELKLPRREGLLDLAPTESRGDGGQNCLHDMSIVGNA